MDRELPVLAIWDQGNRGFERQCLEAYENGYILYSIEHSDNGYNAIFLRDDVRLASLTPHAPDLGLVCPECGFEYDYPRCGKCGGPKLTPSG